MAFSAFALSCLAWASGSRMRRNAKESSSSSSCESLLSLNVRGHKFGDVASLVCSAWPSNFGEFPIDFSGVNRSLHLALDEGGIYDDIKNIAEKRSLESEYCWKDIAPKSQGVCPTGFKYVELQVMEVANMVNSTNVKADKLVKTIGRSARFADFGFTVVRNVVAMYKEYQPQLDKKSAAAVSLILLFQYSGERAGQAARGVRWQKFKDAVKKVAKKILELATGFLETFDQVLEFIKKVVANADPEFLEKVDRVIKAYNIKKCASKSRSSSSSQSSQGRKGRKGGR